MAKFNEHSPLQGLFHQAISQSGTARSIWSQIPRRIARKKASAFATLAGCYYESIEETIKCLRTISVREIVGIQRKFHVNPNIKFTLDSSRYNV